MKTLRIYGHSISSIDDIYRQVLEQFPEKKSYFWYNLDALYDMLSEWNIDTITIYDHISIREILWGDASSLWDKKIEKSRPNYYDLIDLFSDIPNISLRFLSTPKK